MEIRENQRVVLTKRLLQEGLFRLLEKKELSKISVTELCMESGINRTTFYKHYGCPDNMLAAAKEQLFQDLLEKLSQGQNGMHEYLEKNFDTDSAKLASTFIGYGAYSMIRQWLAEDIARTPKEMETIIHKLLNNGLFQSI